MTSTPMFAAVQLACTFVALGAGLASGVVRAAADRAHLRIPRATLLIFALLVAAFCVQLAVPGFLPLCAREPSLIQRGELWRAITALFAQDGGVPGAIFNMTLLVLVGGVAEQVLGARRWLAIYFGAGVATEFLALAWQPHGAGNSIAVFGLAGALTATGVGRKMTALQILLGLAGAAAGAGLLIQRSIHGIGFWTGAAIWLALALASRRPASRRQAEPSSVGPA